MNFNTYMYVHGTLVILKNWKQIPGSDPYLDYLQKLISCVNLQKLTRRWDTRTWHRSILLPLLRLTPPTEGFSWDDLRKFCTEVKEWLRYKIAKKYCRKFQPPE